MENKLNEPKKGIIAQTLTEVTQPFKDLFKVSKAHNGINISYLIEGLTYFGVLGLLTNYFGDYIKLNDIDAGLMVGILTGGITFSMLLLGATVDLFGLRKALLLSLFCMLAGRLLLTFAPSMFSVGGIGSPMHYTAMFGIFWIIIGYGIYQPACYAAVKYFTNDKTSAMGYAMLYALMNLGGFLPGLISPPLREAYGITGVFGVFSIITFIGIIIPAILVTKRSVQIATINKQENQKEDKKPFKEQMKFYIANFPLRDMRFLFFITILIPVQTLFAHNWLTLPDYFERAFTGVISEKFEFFVNFNPILIFILTPAVAALTAKKNTYTMMIIGTFVMASPTFILALGPNIWNVFAYLIIMTVGEAMWQPRFLQWVADIAPKGMTGIYMGIGQFPWFLTKVITAMYSGWFLMNYIPENAPKNTMNSEGMWLIYGFIAVISPIGLLLARKWMMKGFKTQA